MRKMITNSELKFLESFSSKAGQKMKTQLSKIEEKNYMSSINQFSAIYTRYSFLQEKMKMSSKHNTSKNLLFTNISNLFNCQKVSNTVKLIDTKINFNKTKTSNDQKSNDNASTTDSDINFVDYGVIKSIDKEFSLDSHSDTDSTNEALIQTYSSYNSNNNSNNIPISVNKDIEEEKILKAKIKEIKNKKLRKGLTSIYINRENRKVLVNSISHMQYLYDPIFFDKISPLELNGHKSSYYTKSVMDPSGDFILSGSTDASIYIWKTNKSNFNKTELKPIQFHGFHNMEVINSLN